MESTYIQTDATEITFQELCAMIAKGEQPVIVEFGRNRYVWSSYSYTLEGDGTDITEIFSLKELTTRPFKAVNDPVLDGVEKYYLRTLLTPFKNQDIRIVKIPCWNKGKKAERIGITIGIERMYLPPYKEGRMYAGIPQSVLYTPEELGLW